MIPLPVTPSSLILLLVCVSTLSHTLSLSSNQFTPQQREMVKKGLLHRLGLSAEPGLARPTLPVPSHMWQIYNDVIEEEDDSDWIRHYYPTELLEENRGLRLSYNLSLSVQNASLEEVRRADLKVKLQTTKRDKTSRGDYLLLAKVYVITDGRIRRLLDSRPIEPPPSSQLGHAPFWLDFDVTAALNGQQPIDNFDIWLELPEGTSLYSSPTHSLSTISYSKKQSAALVVFSELREPPRVRRKRQTRGGRKKNRKHKLAVERDLCQKKELYVDFEELNWQDWILAPKGYEAGQCSGSCPHPLPAHLNATNHAIIQALLHSLNPQVPQPCCVPTEMSPLAILYMDIDNRIVIKNYSDMRVNSCGCR